MVVLHSPSLTVERPGLPAVAGRRRRCSRPTRPSRASRRRSRRSICQRRPHRGRDRPAPRAHPNEMVPPPTGSRGRCALGTATVAVNLTGASGMWSDFNEANREAMLKSELFSWPVTLAILVLAFGSLVAAGLPLMLTIVGLVASAGVLYLGTLFADLDLGDELRADVRARARHRLRAVHRRCASAARSSAQGLTPVDAVGATMDTAGKAVLFSGRHGAGLALGGDARAEPGLPLDGARDHGRGRLRPRRDADAAAGGARRSSGRGSTSVACPGCTRASTARRGSRAGRAALAPAAALRRSGAVVVLLALAAAGARAADGHAVDQGRARASDPSRVGYTQVRPPSAPARPARCRSSRPRRDADARSRPLRRPTPGIAAVMPRSAGRPTALALIQAVPSQNPSDPAVGATVDRLRADAAARRAGRRRGRREPRPRERRSPTRRRW